uniref:Uncharacterized protein n=1 Tax=Tetraselmis sp. GSL018 TaxID=582737 RepID=A0A061QTN7_9CHLO
MPVQLETESHNNFGQTASRALDAAIARAQAQNLRFLDKNKSSVTFPDTTHFKKAGSFFACSIEELVSSSHCECENMYKGARGFCLHV